jgi:putative ABC transport system substrate-binding protein
MLDMRRRNFITLVGGATTAWPVMARAQQPEGMRRLAVLLPLAAGEPPVRIAAFLQGLRELGWADGLNVQIDYRWGEAMPKSFASTRRNWSRSYRT